MSHGKNNRWNQWATNTSNLSRERRFGSDVSKSPSLVKSEPMLPIGKELKANGHPKSPILNSLTYQRDPVTRMMANRQARNAFQLGMKLQEYNSQGRTTSDMPQRNYSVQNQNDGVNNRAWFVETDFDDEMDDDEDEDLDGENLNGRSFGTGNKSGDFATNPATPRHRRPARSKSAQPFMSTFGQARDDHEQGPQIIREIYREILPMYYGQAPATPIEPF